MQEPDAAAMTSDSWYYEHEGARRGPHSLAEMKKLVEAGVIRRTTLVSPPTGEPTAASELLALIPASAASAGLEYIVPVNRDGWAIAAGYLGLFSFIPVLNYVGLAVSVYAAYHLKKHPQKLGWGRVITGLVISIPMSIFYTYLFLSR